MPHPPRTLSTSIRNGTALLIYDLFGAFGPFHWLALVSLTTVAVGMVFVIRRRPRGTWMRHHAEVMSWSYVGLMAAGAAEVMNRGLTVDFGQTVALTTLVVVGGILIHRVVPTALGPAQRRSRDA